MKSLIAFALSLSLPTQVWAISKLYERDGQVILVNGVPCFFSENLSRHPNWKGFSLTVEERVVDSQDKTAWSISTQKSVNVPIPKSKEECVIYGGDWPKAITNQPPVTLRENVQYLMIIDTPDEQRHGGEFVNRHAAKFCIARQKNGMLNLVAWGKRGIGCGDEPLNEIGKPSFFEKLFN